MKLVIISHKPCWKSDTSPSGYATDGGFPMQIEALSKLFDQTTLLVPVHRTNSPSGITHLGGKNLQVRPLLMPTGKGIKRRFSFLIGLLQNAPAIFHEVRSAEAVHSPIPGDMGTIGMLIAFLMHKPLFVRHCGNWNKRHTIAEKFWCWFMERFAGGRNVFMATGGVPNPPSEKNPQVSWIFSTSLTSEDIRKLGRESKAIGLSVKEFRLITVGRLEKSKNISLIIEALTSIKHAIPNTILHIVGDGSEMSNLKRQAIDLGLEQYVYFHGQVSHAQVTHLLNKSHIFCFPSESEGFPKAVLEGLACGLPVVASSASILPTLISDEAGEIIKEITPQAIAASVLGILQDHRRYSQLSNNAQRIAKEYSLENWANLIDNRLYTAWGELSNNG